MNNKRGFSRGRKPGSKLTKRNKTANPNDRPGLRRFSVSMPIELARTLAKLKPMLDLEYSKLFRQGIDLVVEERFGNGKIDRKTYDEYWNVRRLFKDEDMTGTVPDLDLEPTDEELAAYQRGDFENVTA